MDSGASPIVIGTESGGFNAMTKYYRTTRSKLYSDFREIGRFCESLNLRPASLKSNSMQRSAFRLINAIVKVDDVVEAEAHSAGRYWCANTLKIVGPRKLLK